MPLIIGIIGKLSSGKDELAKILAKYDFKPQLLPTVNIVDYLDPNNIKNLEKSSPPLSP